MTAPLLIAQRLNSGGSAAVLDALRRRDVGPIAALARRQEHAGADYLDIHAAAPEERREPEALAWLAEAVQDASDVPLCLDSRNPDALRRVLPLCRRPPLLNCFSGALAQPAEALQIIGDNAALPVVAVCDDVQGTRTDVGHRVAIAARLVDQLAGCGVAPANVILDPVTLPASCGAEAKRVTLRTMEALRQRFPVCRVLCAIGNISYGLARRRPVERRYAAEARAAGADVFLCDVLDGALVRLLTGL